MADTLLAVVQRVLRATQQDPSVTSLSDNDDTNYIADRINDALINLRTLKPTHLDNNATITVTAQTRLFTVPTGLDVYDIERTSFRLYDGPIEVITLETLKTLDPEYDTREGERVHLLYYEDNKVGVYPQLESGSTSITLKYRHPDVWARLDDAADTFPYPDPYWITYCERYAQYKYEVYKGLGNPIATQLDVDDAWQMCVARAMTSQNYRIRGYKRY